MLSNLLSCISPRDDDEEPKLGLLSFSRHSAAEQWRLLHGEHHWRGLLRPLHTSLRRHLIHYGEMAQAATDAFIRESRSKYAGRCRYSKRDFFRRAGLDHPGRPHKYHVTKYFYATSDLDAFPKGLIVVPLSREGPGSGKETNWMGYVAVADDEAATAMGRRDVVVVWRGSVQPLEWINDFRSELVAAPEVFGVPEMGEEECMVHEGFYNVYTSDNPDSPLGNTSARHQVLEEIKSLLTTYEHEDISITLTGHSLGAALATLNALDIAANALNRKPDPSAAACPVTALLFGCPRVGNSAFHALFSTHERAGPLRALRVRNAPDVVPALPPLGYADVGEEVAVDTRNSTYLKAQPPGSFLNWHNLEVYLHGVAGGGRRRWQRFKLEVERDVALVNKRMDNLKEEFGVPVGWWVEGNKGMVQKEDGSWDELGEDDDYEDDDKGTSGIQLVA